MTNELLKMFAKEDVRDSHFVSRGTHYFHRNMLHDLVATLYLLIPQDALSRDVFSLHHVTRHASPRNMQCLL